MAGQGRGVAMICLMVAMALWRSFFIARNIASV